MSMFKRLWNNYFQNDNRPEHFKSLDGLRGIAILLVLLSHSSLSGIFFSPYLNFCKIGKIGVYLFFVLSAYLLDRQISVALISNRANLNFWKVYLQKRFLRIYPMYIVALLLFGALDLFGFKIFGRSIIDQALDIPLHLLLLKGESIFWSIPVEFKYYLISPFILLFCHKYLKWNFNYVFIFISILVIITMIFHYFFNMSANSTFSYFPIFLTGTFIAITELLKKDIIVKHNFSILVETCGILSLIIVFFTIPYYFTSITGKEFNFQRPILYLPYAVLWGTVLVAAKFGWGFIRWFLELKFLRFFGIISFSMYLIHLPVLAYISLNGSLPEQTKIYLFFAITVIISSWCYFFIERPASKIKLWRVETEE